jgi:hypothetical protein
VNWPNFVQNLAVDAAVAASEVPSMWCGAKTVRRGAVAAVVLMAVLASAAQAGRVLKLEEFSGYWSGVGVVTWANGSSEQLKCVATYKSAASDVRQNLRCASPGYSISASVDLKVAGETITGTWEEKTYSANGLITGTVTDVGFALSIKGPTFSAAMTLNHTACKQAIDIAPTGVDVTKISIGLGKC